MPVWIPVAMTFVGCIAFYFMGLTHGIAFAKYAYKQGWKGFDE